MSLAVQEINAIGYEVYGDIGECCIDTITGLKSVWVGENTACECGTVFKSTPVDKQKATSTTVQTLIFDNSVFTSAAEAQKWAREHGFSAAKVDKTGNSFRIRQKSPGSFQRDSFRTITLRRGVKAVIGRPKEKVSEPNGMEEKDAYRRKLVEKMTSIEHEGITEEVNNHVHSFKLFAMIGPNGQMVGEPFGFTRATSAGDEHVHKISNLTETASGGDDDHRHAIKLPITITLQTEKGVSLEVQVKTQEELDRLQEEIAGNKRTHVISEDDFARAVSVLFGGNHVREEKSSSSSEAVEKKAVPFKKFPKAPEGTAWSFTAEDGNRLIERGGIDLFRSVHSWEDPNIDRENKGRYKLPIAKVVDGQVKVVFRGVAAAMGTLLGARGGAKIPDADRRSVYARLVRYYRSFERTPPEFK